MDWSEIGLDTCLETVSTAPRLVPDLWRCPGEGNACFSGGGLFWMPGIGAKVWECALQYKAPCSDFTQDLMCVFREAGGREGKVRVFKNNMLFPDFEAEGPAGCWEGPAPQLGATGEVWLSFSHSICSQPLAVSPGRTSVGTVPVSLPLQALAFLNVI